MLEFLKTAYEYGVEVQFEVLEPSYTDVMKICFRKNRYERVLYIELQKHWYKKIDFEAFLNQELHFFLTNLPTDAERR